MEAASSSETSVNFCRNTSCHIPADTTFHSHRLEDFKSYIIGKSTPFFGIIKAYYKNAFKVQSSKFNALQGVTHLNNILKVSSCLPENILHMIIFTGRLRVFRMKENAFNMLNIYY
jgi:hypothetical protein